MAEQRTQVRQFQAPTQSSLTPAARPVETYVKTSTPQVKSELSNFLTAISPAFQASAQQRKVDRLKKEKEVADGIQRNKEFQLNLRAKELIGNLGLDYVQNEREYLQKDKDVVLQEARDYFSEYTDTLPTDLDPTLRQDLENALELGLADFMGKVWSPKKWEFTQTELLEDFGDSVRQTNLLVSNGVITLEEGKARIAEEYTQFHSANGDYFRTDDNKVNDFLVKMAHSEKDSAPFSALTEYLFDSKLSKNQLNKSRYTKESDDISATRTTVNNKRLKAQAKTEAMSNALTEVFSKNIGSPLDNLSYTDPTTGKVTTFTDIEKEQAILSSPEFNNMTTGQKYQFLGKIGLTPTALQGIVNDAAALLRQGQDVSTPQTLETIQAGFLQYQAMKNSGMDMSFLDEPTRKKFQAMQFVLQDQARVGERTLVDETLLTDPYEEQEAYRTIQDYNAAASIVQNMSDDVPFNNEFTKEVESALNTWWPKWAGGTDLTDIFNTAEVQRDVAKTAHMLFQTGAYSSIEDAAKVAARIAEEDYPIVESSDGTKYAFKLLNTDIDSSVQAVNIINDYNKTLPPLMADYMQKVHGLKEGEFTVGLYPDSTGKGIIIKAWDIREKPSMGLPPIGGSVLSKKGVLTNIDQLNQLVAQAVSQEPEEPTVTFTPDVNKLTSSMKTIEDTLMAAEKGGIGVAFESPTGTETAPSEADQLLNEALQAADDALTPQGKSMAEQALDSVSELFTSTETDGIKAEDVETISPMPSPTAEETINNIKDLLSSVTEALNPVSEAAAATLIEDEGFSSTPYDDMGKQSVGHGLQIESLEPDERALIKDINNVQPDESAAVVALKVRKTQDFFTNEVDGFENLPESAQSAMVQMGYQLGRFNVKKEWPKFMASMKEAAKYAEGSAEQAVALAQAQFNMLYNVAKDGTVYATDWAKQTKDRATKVAQELGSSISEAFIGTAEASTMQAPPKIEKKDEKSIFQAFQDFNLVPSNSVQFLKNAIFGDTEVDASDLSSSDINYLRGIAKDKLSKGQSVIDYPDFGFTNKSVLKTGLSDAFFNSQKDPKYRMAYLLGASEIVVEDGKVYISDTYNFNKGALGIKFKKLFEKGEYTKAYKSIENLTGLEQLRVVAYLTQPDEAVKKGVKIYLGTVDELK